MTVNSGCLIDSNITIGPSTTLKARTKIVSEQNSDSEKQFKKLETPSVGYYYEDDNSDQELDLRNLERSLIDYESPDEYTDFGSETDQDSESDSSDQDSDQEQGLF